MHSMESLKSLSRREVMFRAPSKSHWQLAEQKLNLRGQDGRQTGDSENSCNPILSTYTRGGEMGTDLKNI